MKNRKWIIVATILAALLVTVAVAQRTARYMHAQHEMGMGGFGEDHFSGFMADYLNLSDQQQQQIKTIMQNEKPVIQPLMKDLHSAHQEIHEAIQNGTLDQAKALSIIDAHKNSFAQLMVEHAKVHQQVMGVLTPDQKTKFEQMEQRHQQRMQQHMQEHMQHEQQASPSPQQ
jgi:protein CpxP